MIRMTKKSKLMEYFHFSHDFALDGRGFDNSYNLLYNFIFNARVNSGKKISMLLFIP